MPSYTVAASDTILVEPGPSNPLCGTGAAFLARLQPFLGAQQPVMAVSVHTGPSTFSPVSSWRSAIVFLCLQYSCGNRGNNTRHPSSTVIPRHRHQHTIALPPSPTKASPLCATRGHASPWPWSAPSCRTRSRHSDRIQHQLAPGQPALDH